MISHAISVDVEDWYQSTFDADADLSDRFERSTDRVLQALDRAQVKGTFFVLGLAAKKAPHVIRTIARAGHELQSHGYGHVELFKLDRTRFAQDLHRAKSLLEDILGTEIFGYRAPSFSIDERTPWAFDVLAETGHRYDSSIFPIKMSRYGVDDYPPEPHIVETAQGHRLVEAPIACFYWLGKRRPLGGGGYFRLLPYWVIRAAFRQLTRAGRPGTVYFHPYEYDPGEISAYHGKVSLFMRLHQGIGRRGFARKIDRLLRDFPMAPLGEVLRPLLEKL